MTVRDVVAASCIAVLAALIQDTTRLSKPLRLFRSFGLVKVTGRLSASEPAGTPSVLPHYNHMAMTRLTPTMLAPILVMLLLGLARLFELLVLEDEALEPLAVLPASDPVGFAVA